MALSVSLGQQKSIIMVKKKRLQAIGIEGESIQLKNGMSITNFPVLHQYGVPLESIYISGLIEQSIGKR
jgi:hypothetical protein